MAQSGRLAGAEFILLDVVGDYNENSSVFLFEDGPLRDDLVALGLTVSVSRRAGRFGIVKRDKSLARALPHLGSLAMVMAEIALLSKRHTCVYANSQKAFVLAAPAAFLTRRTLIWHLHDILSPEHFGAMQRRVVVTLANRLAARVIVPSMAAAAAFVAAGGRTSLLRVVANGLDVKPETERPAEVRRALNLPEGFVFGVFSRLSPWKGQHVAIEALVHLPGTHCVIAGSALFGEDAYASKLKDLAKRHGVGDRVSFLGQRTDVLRLMRAVDVVVHPSVDAEPFGRTIVEAMLCRVPVVAAWNGAAPEILDEGRAGILVPPGDAAALARALSSIMTDASSSASMVDRAERRALQLYTKARMKAKIRDVLTPLESSGHDRH